MECFQNTLIKTTIISIILLSIILFAQDIDNQLSEYDSLRVQDTIPDLSKRDSLFRSLDSTLLPAPEIIDSLTTLGDSLITPFVKVEVDSQQIKFMQAVKKYRENKFFEALEQFNKIYAIPIDSNRFKSASQMMLIKTYLRIGKISKVISLGYEFETNFYNSDYLDDVRYSIARALFKKKDYSQSLLYYLQVVKEFKDPQLEQRCIAEMNTLIDIFLTVRDLERLKNTINDDFYKPYLMLKLAEKYHARGQTNNANKYLLSAYQYQKDNSFIKLQYENTAQYLEAEHKRKIYIGVILPLSGSRAEIGQQILHGVKFAINEIKSQDDFDIAAIIMDNQGDFIRSVKQAQILVDNPKVKAIFGPLNSQNTLGIGAVANQAGIPYITPTATNSKISEMGRYGFQANIDFENLGRFLGQYCLEATDTKNLISLSPGGDFGTQMTDAFSKTIDKGGIKLLNQKWYSGVPKNLGYHFKDFRKIGIEVAQQKLKRRIKSLEDSLVKVMRQDSSWLTEKGFQIFPYDSSKYEVYHNKNMYILDTREVLAATGLIDTTEFNLPDPEKYDDKIESIDAIFLPVVAENLEMILSQLDYYNIEAIIFGNAAWDNLEAIRKNRNIIEELYFISDYYINRNSKRYQSFQNKYNDVMGSLPKRFNLYGYDSIQPFLLGLLSGEIQREQLQHYLLEMPVYKGIARNICFNGHRPGVNCSAFILAYKNNQIVPVARVEKGEVYPFE